MMMVSISKVKAMEEPFSLSVRTLTNNPIIINISENATIQELKEAIAKVNKTPVEKQRIIFSGRELVDPNATLKESAVKKVGVIHMVVRLDTTVSLGTPPSMPARKLFYFTPYQKIGMGITAVALTVALIRWYKNTNKEIPQKI